MRAVLERNRARRFRCCGSCPLSATDLVLAPVSTFASAFVFAFALVRLVAVASLSKSAPRLSRCLHHHEPGAREARRAAAKQEAVDAHSNARFGGEVEWNRSGTKNFPAVSNSNGSTALLITD